MVSQKHPTKKVWHREETELPQAQSHSEAEQQLLLHTSCFPSEETEILCVMWEEGDKRVTLGDITG